MSELLKLAEQVERASPEMQGRLIEQAWDVLARHSVEFRRFALAPLSGFDNNAAKFAMALEARAFESAALMLAPEGWEYTLMNANGYPEATLTNHAIQRTVWAPGETLSLALCAAALRARASQQ